MPSTEPPNIPSIGDKVRTPRFPTAEIAAVFALQEDAWESGFIHTTEDYTSEEPYRVYAKQYGKDLGQLRFAVVLMDQRG